MVQKPNTDKLFALVLEFGRFVQYQKGFLTPRFSDPRWEFFLYQVNKVLRGRYPNIIDISFHERFDDGARTLVNKLYGSDVVLRALEGETCIDTINNRMMFNPVGHTYEVALGLDCLLEEMFKIGLLIKGFYY